MCYVIITGRSLLWTLLSLAALMAVLSGLITPRWLVGPPTIKDTSKYFLFHLGRYSEFPLHALAVTVNNAITSKIVK